MTLEDHIGDIVEKGCAAAGVSTQAAAKAAGLSEAEFGTFLKDGHSSKKPNYTALATLAKLNPTKLEGIANGWLPATPDLSIWRELRQITTPDDDMHSSMWFWITQTHCTKSRSFHAANHWDPQCPCPNATF